MIENSKRALQKAAGWSALAAAAALAGCGKKEEAPAAAPAAASEPASVAAAKLLPDGKTQVTIEYSGDRAVRVDTVLVSTQHAERIDHA